jgi:DNA repair protein RecO (recombination protein O)
VFLRKSSDALDLLTEAKLERRFRVREAGLGGLHAAYYVAELLNELTHDNDPHPELFDAADATLVALGLSGDAPAHVTAEHVLRFEMSALRLLGHMPSLDACAECGAAIADLARVPFGHTSGGVLCAACRPGKRNVVSLSAGALAALRRLSEEPSEAIEERPLENPSIRGEVRGVLNHYLAHLIGRELRTQKAWSGG